MSDVHDWNHHETMNALRASQELVSIGLEAVQDFLRSLHGREYTSEFVRLVHGFWIQHLCQDVVYASLSATQEAKRRLTDVIVPISKPHYPNAGSAGVSRVDLARRLFVEGRDVQDLMLSCVAKSQQLMPKFRHLKSDLLSTLSANSTRVWIAAPYLRQSVAEQIRIAVQSRQLIRWEEPDPVKVSPDLMNSRIRQSAYASINGNSRGDVLRALVPLTIPVELSEALPMIEDRTQSLRRGNTRLIYSANAHHYDACFKVAAAQMLESGARLLVHQHGGGYGIDEQHPGEMFDRSVSHRFYTWGWTEQGSGSLTKPLPTAPRGKRREPDSHYLLVAAENTREFFRFQSFCMPTHSEKCISESLSFLSEVNESHVIQLRSAPTLPFPVARIGRLMCKIQLDQSKKSALELASRAKLVIHNYLGTSWLETLAMNIPTVCFYDPAMYRPRVAAQTFIDALARVGVIHYSGKEAAKFVNSLRGEPSTWWKSAEVQEAREAFVARYANFSDNWLEAWQEEFESLLAE
jgi:putative transferase (TIGR04331 family)